MIPETAMREYWRCAEALFANQVKTLDCRLAQPDRDYRIRLAQRVNSLEPAAQGWLKINKDQGLIK